MKIRHSYILVAILLIPLSGLSQSGRKIKYKADKLEFGKRNGESVRKLTDNVRFEQKNTVVYCDSALFYRDRNVMEAFGHVRIIDDSVRITSEKLIYEGDERKAKLREDVVYTRGERRLYTDFLDYDLETEVANYFNGGRLQDPTNTLTSKIGYFYAKQNYAQFWTEIKLVAPDYVLTTDTLRYNTVTKIAVTKGPTKIVKNDGTVLYSNGGEFRTVSEQSEFVEGNIETPDYFLEGDELFFDDLNQYYKAIGNVKLVAKERDVIIEGEEGFYDRESGLSKIYGNPLMKRILAEADTFYLASDTLVAIESEYDSAKRILGYNNVKLYKEGLQGIADSLSYFRADSLIYFYHDPIMWNDNHQIEADTIFLEISGNSIRKMNMIDNSFITSEDTLQNYNQIKGRTMITYFVENEIEHIDVNGNGELLYYALEEDTATMGLNKIFCSNMTIRFEDRKLINFTVYQNPEAQFIPPHEFTVEIQRLPGFSWRPEERPTLYDLAPYRSLDPGDSLSAPRTELNLDSIPDADGLIINQAPDLSDAASNSELSEYLQDSTANPATGGGASDQKNALNEEEALNFVDPAQPQRPQPASRQLLKKDKLKRQ